MTIRQRRACLVSVASLAAVGVAGCAGLAAPKAHAEAVSALAPATPVPRPPEVEAVKQRVALECAAGLFSGVIAVEQHGQLLYLHACGWADPARTVRLHPSSLFRIFSLTKTFTATTVLQLIDAGRMSLDAPLTSYLSQVPHEWQSVTIRDLLVHQSGIPDHTDKLLEAYRSQGHRSHQAAMHHVVTSLTAAEAALLTPPGETWRYTNFGYELLAAATAAVERRPFHQIIREQLFHPASLPAATLEQPNPDFPVLKGVPIAGLVTGFNGSASDNAPVETIYSLVQQGAGALVANYSDLLAFTRALHAGKLLSPAMLARIEPESVLISGGVRYGFGWMVRKAGTCTYWQHSGGTNGYVSELAYEPDSGLTIAVLSNLGYANATRYRRELVEGFLAGGSPAAKACAN